MLNIGQSAGKNYAYLLGVYLGDGCVTQSGRTKNLAFRLNTIDMDFAVAVKEALCQLTGKNVWIGTYPVKKSSKPNNGLGCVCTDFCNHLVEITKNKTIIPDLVTRWPNDIKKEFIIGLMDSEGYVAEDKRVETNRRYFMGYKSCDPWIYDLVNIMHSVGIKTNKLREEKPRKPWYKIPRVFTIKIQSWVDAGMYFNIRRKQKRVEMFVKYPSYSIRKRRRLSSETIRSDS